MALAASPPSADAAPPVFEFIAGFDGWYRVGAFTPIVVDASSTDTPFDGVIVIDTGASTYAQALSLPAPSRKRLEFYIRLNDQRDRLSIRAIDADGTPTQQQITVRSVLPGEQLTVIAQGAAAAPGDGRVAVVRVQDLPRSWRGYDGVTDVIDAGATLDSTQASALARWRARPTSAFDDRPLRAAVSGSTALDPASIARWRFFGGYLLTTLVVLWLTPLITRRAGLIATAVIACGAIFVVVAPRYAAFQSTGDAARVATAVRPGTDGGPAFFSTVARVDATRRDWLTVDATAETLLRPLADVPHRTLFREDGQMSVALPMVVGESLTLGAQGFSAVPGCSASDGGCTLPASAVGIDTAAPAVVIDAGSDEPW